MRTLCLRQCAFLSPESKSDVMTRAFRSLKRGEPVAIGSDVGVRVMCCCAAADSRAMADTASSRVDGA